MKKQFVWIMTDTTRYDMLSCYGIKEVNTPNLDKMAREGMRFEYAYTTQPVCGPARVGLFTGLYPHNAGSWGNSQPLGVNVKTIGERISSQGIPCGYIGKWHLDHSDYFGRGVAPEGWDKETWYDMRNYLDELGDDELRKLSRNRKLAGEDFKTEDTFAYRCLERGKKFIEEHKDEDFLLVISLDEPHGPSVCPKPFANMFENYNFLLNETYNYDRSNKPYYQKIWDEGTWNDVTPEGDLRSNGLLECNCFVDALLGDMFSFMEEKVPNCSSLFTSDHGDAMSAHGICGKGATVYDEVSRVPLIFKGPKVKSGTVYPHPVSHIDLPATVLEYMGVDAENYIDGKSLSHVLENPELHTDRPVFVEYNRYEHPNDQFGGFQPMRAIITDDYKLAIHLLSQDEMYDVKKDPKNLVNIINNEKTAKVRDELHDLLEEWMLQTCDPMRGYYWMARPWRVDRQPQWSMQKFANCPDETGFRSRNYFDGSLR